MGVNLSSKYGDVNEDAVLQGNLTVGTAQTEIKVGGSPLTNRQVIRLYNKSNSTVYVGPTGVTTSTGEPVKKNQWIELATGSQQIFAVVESGTEVVTVWEMG